MFNDGILLLTQADVTSIFAMFWHSLLFEFPRFLLAMLAISTAEAVGTFGTVRPNANFRPSISVLLPGHNEGASLRQAIIGLREQTRNDVEIVVIDDGSTDDMADIGNQLKAEGLIDTFIYRGMRSGKSAAANLGLDYCSGEIIVIADIDTSFDRDGIERIVEPFADPRVGGVAGNIAVRNADTNILTRFQAIQYFISISLGRRVSDMFGVLFIASGAFAAFRREALVSVGGWEVGPGEDADVTIKLRRAGWAVKFQPQAWALTDVPETLTALAKQRMRWNRSLVRVRARKFKLIFNPFMPNFSIFDALGTIDIIFFQAVLPASFVVYIVWLFAHFGLFAWVIVGAVTTFYIVGAFISFLVAMSLAGHHGRGSLMPYVPGYALFNAYVMRTISVAAYLDELIFRNSYRDSYVPMRVSKQVEHF